MDVWHYARIKQQPEKKTNPSRNAEHIPYHISPAARHTQQCPKPQKRHRQQTQVKLRIKL